jgi:hypothetical protein
MMNLSESLKEAWKYVEAAYNSGYMVNESMMAFVLWKAINERRPDLCITYDARIDSRKRYRPDLVVWNDGAKPSVLFVCELKFKPEYYSRYKEDIAKLQTINQSQQMDVLKRNPVTGETETISMSKADSFGIGFFAISNYDAAAVTHNNVIQGLSASERAIFHFAFGSIPGNENRTIKFEYHPPPTEII